MWGRGQLGGTAGPRRPASTRGRIRALSLSLSRVVAAPKGLTGPEVGALRRAVPTEPYTMGGGSRHGEARSGPGPGTASVERLVSGVTAGGGAGVQSSSTRPGAVRDAGVRGRIPEAATVTEILSAEILFLLMPAYCCC